VPGEASRSRDPAIHQKKDSFRMDARVKPADDR